MQVKNHGCRLSPRILLEPHSIWMGESNHKKNLHFLARPIIGLGAQTLNKIIINHTWAPPVTAKRPQINTGKGKTFRAKSRTIPVPTINSVRKHQSCFFQTVDISGEIYTDQTGSSPVTSIKIKKYILITYHYLSNKIHAEPLKTRSGLYLTAAYQKLHSLLKNRGLRPHLHILDN